MLHSLCVRHWLILPLTLTMPIGAGYAYTVESSSPNTSPSVIAQTLNDTPPGTLEQPILPLPRPQEEIIEPTVPQTQPPETRPTFAGTITVKEFEFVGNTAFSNEELAEVTQEYTNRPLTFAELLEAEEAVNEFYSNAGYINSGAVIAANQTLDPTGAVVTIQIIEGGVQDIIIEGTTRLNPNYVRSRLAPATETPLNSNRLLEALQLLQLDPLIANLSAELSPGAGPGLSTLEIEVTEADPLNVELFVDNGRAPSVGSFRRGVNLSYGNVVGIGDRASLSYTNTEGSNAVDLQYAVPLTASNDTLSFAAGFTSTEVVEAPFNRLEILGDSYYYQLSLRQPLIQTPTTELAYGLTLSHSESQTELLGEGFPISPGADENGETSITALRFFSEWVTRSPEQVFALRSQFNLGFDFLGATINADPPDGRFFSWRGQGQYVRLLAPETLLVLRSDVQLSTSALVPLEQFALGGLQSVRGYRQDVFLTDNGVLASAELRYPLLEVPSVRGVLHLVPFVDFGFAWNNDENPRPDPEDNTLVGVGVGLQWEMRDRLFVRLDYGVPLTDIESNGDSLQEEGFYFQVTYSPF